MPQVLPVQICFQQHVSSEATELPKLVAAPVRWCDSQLLFRNPRKQKRLQINSMLTMLPRIWIGGHFQYVGWNH